MRLWEIFKIADKFQTGAVCFVLVIGRCSSEWPARISSEKRSTKSFTVTDFKQVILLQVEH